MKTIQQKFESEIEGVITAAHLEPVISRDYGNTGTIYAQSIGGHATIVSIKFDFQRNGATLFINNDRHGFDYTEQERIDRFFAVLRDSVKGKGGKLK